jgi:hypothetical protein
MRGVDIAHVIGIWTERARDTRPAVAALLGVVRAIGLLTFRRRQRRVVRGFRRDLEAGLELGDARLHGANQLGLRFHQRDQVILVERVERIGSHAELESARRLAFNPTSLSPSVA